MAAPPPNGLTGDQNQQLTALGNYDQQHAYGHYYQHYPGQGKAKKYLILDKKKLHIIFSILRIFILISIILNAYNIYRNDCQFYYAIHLKWR